MTARRPVLLLVNPSAGGKPGSAGHSADDADGEDDSDTRQGSAPDALAARLADGGLQVELRITGPDDDLRQLAVVAVSAGKDVVVAGGDGTVGPVAAALAGTDAALGIVPLGSFNNIARGAGLPLALGETLEIVIRGAVMTIDAGLAWRPTETELRAGSDATLAPDDASVFFEAVGIGIDAAGFGAAAIGERRGPWFALRAGWRAMRRRETPVRLVLDGREEIVASPAVTVCNGPYHGFGFALAPDAVPSDGVLDVVVFDRMSRWAVVRHFLRVARGRPRREPRLRIERARRVEVSAVRGSLPVHADGRGIGPTPVRVTIRPGALRLFADASSLSPRAVREAS